MASLPQAAFAVHKLRKPQNEKNLAVARQSMDKQESPRFMKSKYHAILKIEPNLNVVSSKR